MKKFRFRLDKVQRVRQLQEDRAKVELQAANRLLAQAEAEQEARLQAYRAVAGAPDAVGAAGWLAQRGRRDLSARSALGAIATRDVARTAVDERRLEWTEKRRRVEALDRLRERRREEWMGELLKDNERLVDDLVAANRIRAEADAARDLVLARRNLARRGLQAPSPSSNRPISPIAPTTPDAGESA